MDRLKSKFHEKAMTTIAEMRTFLKDHGDTIIDQVAIEQVIGGMRGIKSMLWETSLLDANEGIRFRGYSISELKSELPSRGDEPLPEGLFWLMLTGDLPTEEDVNWLSDEWERRRQIPDTTWKVLDALPMDTHPMTQLGIAVLSLQAKSEFARRYSEGMNKRDYWDATYEDSMNLIGCLPQLAAYIYRRTYFDNQQIAPDDSLDWSSNYAHMLGVTNNPDFQSLMRLYMTIHADHEGGNASAHAVHLAGSTLSDTYYSLASGINALAGPLHGLANQEVIKWIFEMVEHLGTTKPTSEQIEKYINDTLAQGQVIPGYGHAVLRKPDPRFLAQQAFAQKHMPDDDIVNIVWKVFDIAPKVLGALGKVSNPWPNVDAHSGAILVHYGLKEYNYYTVLFAVSRSLGVLASLCWSRILNLPLERPKSLTYESMKQWVEKRKE
ncbi:MAG: citrate (Si)-synthase [Bacteroidota bacterium]|nr:citrate (Si)-synthase [Bacteroidota bacterium]